MKPCIHLYPRQPDWQRIRGVIYIDDTDAPPRRDCLLLPTSDATAVWMSTHAPHLRRAGWVVRSASVETLRELDDKARLMKRAVRLGLGEFVPHSRKASFPSVVKPSLGVAGEGVRIVQDAHELADAKKDDPTAVVQAYVPGRFEHSTLLWMRRGRIIACLNTMYEYDSTVYTWPNAREVSRRSLNKIGATERHVFGRLLHDYDGICNVNYKMANRRPMILEVNVRVGADLGDANDDATETFLRAIYKDVKT